LHSPPDDGIVVVGMTLDEYLSGPEEMRRRELVWGEVREPPSPYVAHQRVITRIATLLDAHVRQRDLGTVLVAPVDVILDAANALVVQPDVMFISRARTEIIRDFVWGAPDLVIEVASRGTTGFDRTRKLGWYRQFGVRECWLVDFVPHGVTVVSFHGLEGSRTVREDERILSEVLPEFEHAANALYE
jgi:Uma2 family endonuclease